MKIGILGGTFNPIHYGHLRVAEEVQEMFNFSRIIFIPSGNPPFKKRSLPGAYHRYKMTKIAIKDNPFFDISDVEIKSTSVSYTVETMKKLAIKHGNAEFFLILGIDTFLDLPKWKRPYSLMRLTNLIVVLRPGCSFVDLAALPYFANVQKKALYEINTGVRKEFSFSLGTGKRGYLCKTSELQISASQIRNLVTAGKSIKYLLPDSVESYIISHKLYQDKCKLRTKK